MKRMTILAATVAFAAGTLHAADVKVPTRKPGLWEITTVAAGTGTTVIKTCVGENDDIATPSDSGECSPPTARRGGEEVFVDVVCTKPHGKMTLSTAFIGDFTTRYHGIMKISFDPPEGLRNMGVIIDGKYLGPDCSAAGDETAPE